MQIGSQIELLVGFGIIALGIAFAWWSDKAFDKATKFKIAFSGNSEMHDAMLASRKEKTKAYVKRW
jgi:hypothetical protein